MRIQLWMNHTLQLSNPQQVILEYVHTYIHAFFGSLTAPRISQPCCHWFGWFAIFLGYFGVLLSRALNTPSLGHHKLSRSDVEGPQGVFSKSLRGLDLIMLGGSSMSSSMPCGTRQMASLASWYHHSINQLTVSASNYQNITIPHCWWLTRAEISRLPWPGSHDALLRQWWIRVHSS